MGTRYFSVVGGILAAFLSAVVCYILLWLLAVAVRFMLGPVNGVAFGALIQPPEVDQAAMFFCILLGSVAGGYVAVATLPPPRLSSAVVQSMVSLPFYIQLGFTGPGVRLWILGCLLSVIPAALIGGKFAILVAAPPPDLLDVETKPAAPIAER